ncbi:MAG: hypothetical protein ACRDEA_23310, partial [Microcystaceae cyanobacterium]
YEITPTSYSLSLDLIPDCMGTTACTFGEVSGAKITANTPKIPEDYTIHQQMWQDPNIRDIPKSLESPSKVQLAQGITGYFIPFFCATACDSSRIIWDLNGYRYQVGIKAAYKKTVIDMANSAILNQQP